MRFLRTATAIGSLCKTRASISSAESDARVRSTPHHRWRPLLSRKSSKVPCSGGGRRRDRDGTHSLVSPVIPSARRYSFRAISGTRSLRTRPSRRRWRCGATGLLSSLSTLPGARSLAAVSGSGGLSWTGPSGARGVVVRAWRRRFSQFGLEVGGWERGVRDAGYAAAFGGSDGWSV